VSGVRASAGAGAAPNEFSPIFAREAPRDYYYRFVNSTYTKLSAACAEASKLFEDSKSGKIDLATQKARNGEALSKQAKKIREPGKKAEQKIKDPRATVRRHEP
jgi:hypothetical protein